jgi:hypothetical protein
MRGRAQALGLLLGIVIGFVSAVGIDAASIDVSPTTVPAGGAATVSGDVLASGGQPGCTVPGTVLLFSAAFGDPNVPIQASAGADAKYSIQALIPASVAPGTYPVTGRCGGGNLGVQGTVVVTGAQLPATGAGGLLSPSARIPSPALAALLFLASAALIMAALRLGGRSQD